MYTKGIRKILVISPHISDAVMGCGGSICKWVKEGVEVHVLSLGPESEVDWNNEVEAGKLLGFIPVDLVNRFKVGAYEYSYAFDIIKSWIKCVRPNVVITVSSKEVQNDHLVTHSATRDAVYYAVREVYWETKESYRCELWVTDCIESFSFVRADHYESLALEDVVEKMKAMKIYDYTPDDGKGPHFDVVHDRNWVVLLANLRGLWVGCKYAEVFQKEEL